MNEKKFFPAAAAVTVLLGAAAFVTGTLLPASVTGNIMGYMKDYLGGIQFSFWGIFLNNLSAALLLFLGGFLLCIPSVFTFFFNFLALGAAYQMTRSTIGTKAFLLSVLPHGIFEIPAIMTAFVLGIALGYAVVRALFFKKGKELPPAIKRLSILFLILVLPLLIIAAFVEVNLTLKLVKAWK